MLKVYIETCLSEVVIHFSAPSGHCVLFRHRREAKRVKENIVMSQFKRLWILRHPDDQVAAQPPVNWALGELETALSEYAISLDHCESIAQVSRDETCVVVCGREAELAHQILNAAGVSMPDSAESLALVPGAVGDRPVTLACGSDVRGLIYALLELADAVIHADEPQSRFCPQIPHCGAGCQPHSQHRTSIHQRSRRQGMVS